MKNRKLFKQDAKKAYKKHYLLFTAVCLMATIFNSEYTYSTIVLKDYTMQFVYMIYEKFVHNSNIFGRERGVLAHMINAISSENIFTRIGSILATVIRSPQVLSIIMGIISFLFFFLMWMFIQNIYKVILRRIILEGRIYHSIPAHRFFFLKERKQWSRAATTMLLMTIYKFLWWFTIVGGIMKTYSYRMVPYIVAENPSIPPRTAIKLSNSMMDGHKWECFCIDCSFIGWYLLGIITLGFSNILYFNAYNASTFCEYYTYLRNMSFEYNIPNVEYLNDTYLFENAGEELLHEKYPEYLNEAPKNFLQQFHGFSDFCSNILGIALWQTEAEKAYQQQQAAIMRYNKNKNEYTGLAYPTRLSSSEKKESKFKFDNTNYIRHYSLSSLGMIFLITSFGGWLWEVILTYVVSGTLVNRGTLYGPWLPIYGFGAVMALTGLNVLRKNPVLEFIGIILLSGIIEYSSSLILEFLHNGERWWDYNGYFINFQGRICAEGLLLFGIGGIAMVYLIAPHLDNMLNNFSHHKLIIVTSILMGIFAFDYIISQFYPNAGAGITDIASNGLQHLINFAV